MLKQCPICDVNYICADEDICVDCAIDKEDNRNSDTDVDGELLAFYSK